MNANMERLSSTQIYSSKSSTDWVPVSLLRKDGLEKEEQSHDSEDAREENSDDEAGENLYCIACGRLVTSTAEKLAINGDLEHVFANPHGIVFHIGTFRHASGCIVEGPLSCEFSWFPGYSWAIANCAGCFYHLGWQFVDSAHSSFWGLITGRLHTERIQTGSS
ncbi:cereblon family protein [Oligoflexia bacterium]|nr:cereblon family protein [Oligoflexia bacterium]